MLSFCKALKQRFTGAFVIITFTFILVSCQSVLDGDIPRANTLQDPVTIVKNNSGSLKVKTVKSALIVFVTDDLNTFVEFNLQTNGFNLYNGTMRINNRQGAEIGTIDKDGNIIPAPGFEKWEHRLEIENIELNAFPQYDNAAHLVSCTLKANALNSKQFEKKYGLELKSIEMIAVKDYLSGSAPQGTFYIYPDWSWQGIIYTDKIPRLGSPTNHGYWKDGSNRYATIIQYTQTIQRDGKYAALVIVGQLTFQYE